MSWNCTEYAIAASYGRFDVSGWCDLPGALLVWNLGTKRKRKPAEGGKGGKGKGGALGNGKGRTETEGRGPSCQRPTCTCLMW